MANLNTPRIYKMSEEQVKLLQHNGYWLTNNSGEYYFLPCFIKKRDDGYYDIYQNIGELPEDIKKDALEIIKKIYEL